MKCVPSLNLVYTEEEGYVTADVAEDKDLVSVSCCAKIFDYLLFGRNLLLSHAPRRLPMRCLVNLLVIFDFVLACQRSRRRSATSSIFYTCVVGKHKYGAFLCRY